MNRERAVHHAQIQITAAEPAENKEKTSTRWFNVYSACLLNFKDIIYCKCAPLYSVFIYNNLFIVLIYAVGITALFH